MGEESDWYTVVPILLDGGGAGGGRGGRKRREEERGIESEREREKNGSEKERGAKRRDRLGERGEREDWKRSSSTLSKPEVVPGFVLKSLRSRRHFQPR